MVVRIDESRMEMEVFRTKVLEILMANLNIFDLKDVIVYLDKNNEIYNIVLRDQHVQFFGTGPRDAIENMMKFVDLIKDNDPIRANAIKLKEAWKELMI